MRGAPLLAWLLLLGAILAELIGTAALKYASAGRSVAWLGVIAGYGAALWLLNLVIARVDVAVVYALWSGIGIAVIAVAGVVLFDERLTALRVLGLLAIVIGIALLQLSGAKNL
jgi:small multidrug resistance pump